MTYLVYEGDSGAVIDIYHSQSQAIACAKRLRRHEREFGGSRHFSVVRHSPETTHTDTVYSSAERDGARS